MREAEQAVSEIDISAAQINLEAAQLLSKATERKTTAARMKGLSRFATDPFGGAEHHQRQVEIADQIVTEANAIREAAQRIQSLTGEIRSTIAVESI